MANKHRGELSIKLGSDTYRLRLGTNATCELEDFVGAQTKTGGRTWDQILLGIDRGSRKDIRLFLWVALREFHPDIATDDLACLTTIGDLIDAAGGSRALLLHIVRLIEANAPPPKGTDEEVPKKARPSGAQAGTGDGSTPTPSPSA
jgi:hypothetical protein